MAAAKNKTPLGTKIFNRFNIFLSIPRMVAWVRNRIQPQGIFNSIQAKNSTAIGLLSSTASTLDIKNADGDTPLIYATRLALSNITSNLIDSGKVDLDATNNKGDCALHIAAREGYEDIVDSLLSEGATADLINPNSGNNALHVIALRAQHYQRTAALKHQWHKMKGDLITKWTTIVTQLINKGAKISGTNKQGESLISLIKNGPVEIRSVFKNHVDLLEKPKTLKFSKRSKKGKEKEKEPPKKVAGVRASTRRRKPS